MHVLLHFSYVQVSDAVLHRHELSMYVCGKRAVNAGENETESERTTAISMHKIT